MNDNTPIITPKDYCKLFKLDKFARIDKPIIIVFNVDVFNTLKEISFKNGTYCGNIGKFENFFDVNINNKGIRIFLTGDGGPSTAFAMEICIERGAKLIIGLGYSTSLDKENLPIGSYYIPNYLVRNDGTSLLYYPYNEKVGCDENMVNIAKSCFNKKYTVKSGRGACVDLLFKHRISDIHKWKNEGAMSVDMESGAFYAVANYNNVKAILINIISEQFNGSKIEIDYPKARKNIEYFFDICSQLTEIF